MLRTKKMSGLSCLPLLLAGGATAAPAVERGNLRVGAARVDITPTTDWGPLNVWGTKLTGVHDHVYARAIVLDNGVGALALVAIDTSGNDEAPAMLQRIREATGIPAGNILLVSTHDHNTPRVGPRPNEQPSPGRDAWIRKVTDAVTEAVRQANQGLQPARFGLGTGSVDININRDELTSQGWKLGNNPAGPSDKTVWVISFEKPTGEPIAFFINYAVHSVVMGPENTAITGDLSGAASRFVEQHYQDRAVALWTSGPAGDQNPKFMTWDTTFTNKTTEPGFSLVDTLGQMLGEEVLRASSSIRATSPTARLWTADKVVTCPARTPARGQAAQANANPGTVDLRLGLFMLDHIALAAVQSEIVTNIYYHLKKDSPFTNTIMVTHHLGSMGYIPEDAAYDRPTFEVSATRFQRGCAENGIVNGFLEMMNQY